jgi:hypothetical protein
MGTVVVGPWDITDCAGPATSDGWDDFKLRVVEAGWCAVATFYVRVNVPVVVRAANIDLNAWS